MASHNSSLKPAGAVVGASAGTDASLMKLDIDNEAFTSNVEPGMFTPTERAAADAAAEQRRRAGYDARGRNGGPFTESYPPPGKAFAGCVSEDYLRPPVHTHTQLPDNNAVERSSGCTLRAHRPYTLCPHAAMWASGAAMHCE